MYIACYHFQEYYINIIYIKINIFDANRFKNITMVSEKGIKRDLRFFTGCTINSHTHQYHRIIANKEILEAKS